MSLSQDILDDIAAEKTTIDSIKALLADWVANGQISAEVAAAIDAAFTANQSQLKEIEAALQPTTPPTPLR